MVLDSNSHSLSPRSQRLDFFFQSEISETQCYLSPVYVVQLFVNQAFKNDQSEPTACSINKNAWKMQAGISDQKLSIQYVNFWMKYILIVLITRIFSRKANTGLEMNRKLA